MLLLTSCTEESPRYCYAARNSSNVWCTYVCICVCDLFGLCVAYLVSGLAIRARVYYYYIIMHCVRAYVVRIFFIILVRACAGEHMGHAHSDYAGSHIKPKPVSVLSCDSPADTQWLG